MVGAAARRTGHRGLDRKPSISSSVTSRMSTSTVVIAASLSPRRQCSLDGGDRARRIREAQARFVDDEVADVVGARGPAHGPVGAVGVAEQGDRSAGASSNGVHHRGHVVEVALDGVVRPVAAGPEASAVHREGGEALAEHVQEGFEGGVVGDRAVDQDERRPLPIDPDGDRRAVDRVNVEPRRVDHTHGATTAGRRSSSAAKVATARAKASGCSA